MKVSSTPPSLIASLAAGFDTVTNHLALVLFPIALDFFLWFGPHLRLKRLIQEYLAQVSTPSESAVPEMAQTLQLGREAWLWVGERLNLFTALRTYPVGIPSLMVSRQPIQTPLGQPPMWEVTSIGEMLFWWLMLTVAGLVLGALYFVLVAQASLNGKVQWRQALSQWPQASLQVLYLALYLVGLIFAVGLPGLCGISLAVMGGPMVGRLVLFFLSMVGLWIFFPLLFSAHGIFAYQHKMWASVRQGTRLIRTTTTRSSLFFLSLLVLSEGFNILWRVPDEASWLSLVGVAGHAFIATALLAGTFVYYRDGVRWVQRMIQHSLLVEGR